MRGVGESGEPLVDEDGMRIDERAGENVLRGSGGWREGGRSM